MDADRLSMRILTARAVVFVLLVLFLWTLALAIFQFFYLDVKEIIRQSKGRLFKRKGGAKKKLSK